MLTSLQRWFGEARFGLFIHWGMYSLFERGEQLLFREHLLPSAYRQRAAEFRPLGYRPDEWAAMAREAGMRYAILTAKHHDGYCLFDSAVSEFTSLKVGPERDLVGEYVDAFREAGLRVGLYYSLADWSWPAYWEGPARDPIEFSRYIEYIHAQVRELCCNYGQIDVLWFDGSWPYSPAEWRAQELVEMIRHLQPGIVINNRTGLHGDFDTPERHIQASERPWEACMVSTERWWGYHAGDRLWKTPMDVIHMLAQVAEGGGNLLLNVGPKADGTWPTRFVELLRQVGQWMAANGDSIYRSSRGVCECNSIGRMSVVDSTVYLHVLYWPGSTVHLCGLKNRVRKAFLLADGWPVEFRQEGEHIYLTGLPSFPPDKRDTVIALQVEGVPQPYDWAADRLWQGDASRMADWARS